jgi:hypothetical protein
MKRLRKMSDVRKSGILWMYTNMFKSLSLNFTDCHSKRHFDQKLSFAYFEGNGRI